MDQVNGGQGTGGVGGSVPASHDAENDLAEKRKTAIGLVAHRRRTDGSAYSVPGYELEACERIVTEMTPQELEALLVAGRSALLFSSARLDQGPTHDRLRLWNRGALCGELVLSNGDGEKARALLFFRPEATASSFVAIAKAADEIAEELAGSEAARTIGDVIDRIHDLASAARSAVRGLPL